MDPRLEKVLKLPLKQKIALLVLVVLVLGAALYFLLIQPKLKELGEFQEKLGGLQKQVEETRRVANNLPKFKAEYERLLQELEAALTELPNEKEIPSLLTSITAAGKGSGLDFLVFKPKPEEPKDFYAAVPVDVVVHGSFFNVANFFVAVGNLPRIVNITNVSFSDIKADKGRPVAKISCLATTFRFLDKKEIKDDKKAKK